MAREDYTRPQQVSIQNNRFEPQSALSMRLRIR